MSHIPLIHGADGAKLSKRHGALGVEAYREMGYLPAALLNYLVRLGWSHGDDEIMSIENMISWFDIGDINKGAARFDFDKLGSINGHYIRHTDNDVLSATLIDALPHLPNGAPLLAGMNKTTRSQLFAAMPGLKDRAKTLVELADGAMFLFTNRPLPIDEKAALLLDAAGRDILKDVLLILEGVADWKVQPLDEAVRVYAESKGLKLGKVAQPLRAALTGRATSPGVFDVLEVLGRDESLARIADQQG
jgi:glutamyl-tRNA synthetase